MTQLLAFLCGFVIHTSIIADKYYQVKIIMRNGSELHGVAYLPEGPAPVPITFKEDGNGKKMKIASDSIKTLVYFVGKEKTLEYDRMDVFLYFNAKKTQRLWLEVSRRGPVTLYSYEDLEIGAQRNLDRFRRHWLCIRPGDDAAKSISSETMKKADFVQVAVAYFKDDTELTKKIESGQYKWNDMEAIVDEYNSWEKNNP
jgi:hypothetical protein